MGKCFILVHILIREMFLGQGNLHLEREYASQPNLKLHLKMSQDITLALYSTQTSYEKDYQVGKKINTMKGKPALHR